MRTIITLLLSFFISIQANAKTYSFAEAVSECKRLGLKQPEPEKDGRIQTLNRKGAAAPGIDEARKEFVKFAKGKKVLQINGNYGAVMIDVLSKYQDTVFHLNDVLPDHLFIAAHNLEKAELSHRAKNAKFIEGNIREGLDIKEQYDAILATRVLHYFGPEQLNAAVGNIKKLLKPGGRVYILAITPYVKRYDNFIPEYEKRKERGEEYPGYVKSLYDWVNKEVATKEQLANISPEPFMFLDEEVLTKVFKKRGYKIISCKLMPITYESTSWSFDGRENVILIAEKE